MLCLGTGTEVGKTWVGAATSAASATRAACRSPARKPVQSFDPDDPHPTDAMVLAGATGEAVESVCAPAAPTRWPSPRDGDRGARSRPLVLDDLVAELGRSWPPGAELGWVEAAGGVRSPFTDDGDGVDLATRLAPDAIVLVADAELGALNAIRLCLDALQPVDAPVTVCSTGSIPRATFTAATSPGCGTGTGSRWRPAPGTSRTPSVAGAHEHVPSSSKDSTQRPAPSTTHSSGASTRCTGSSVSCRDALVEAPEHAAAADEVDAAA